MLTLKMRSRWGRMQLTFLPICISVRSGGVSFIIGKVFTNILASISFVFFLVYHKRSFFVGREANDKKNNIYANAYHSGASNGSK